MSLQVYKVPQEGEGFDLTPMIDVVFLLIVFFMTVASMLAAEKIDMNLAVAEESAIPKAIKERATFSVLPDGSYYSGAKQISESQLNAEMERLVELSPKIKIVVRADKMAEHRHVNKLLSICAQNGINDIIFATYQSDL
ncbi:biopolymer transporter ExbD [Coraliomargarita sp. SDUM461003]|uniref:Biopolymer transporter ExbD n=1 Tax=Thalassobacterium maritimum TaxID=3041265 RepID=A0ABU1ATP7_9BACT|nr:biopolymer transporter ExbD [Coraliomargarita sp. SDUM461003]MDQ8207537.1 biopolymer transporter ExbD [Coraliomargarita sp. SDUM461003]